MKNNKNPYGPLSKEDTLYQNTYALLKNYREITWSIKASTVSLKEEINHEFFMSIDEYLNSLYGAGVTKFDIKLENHAKQVETSRQLLSLLMSSIEFIKENHEYGEEYYYILYYTFLYKTKLSLEQILSSLAKEGYACGYRTYYRKRNEAIETLSIVLWGATMRSLKLPSEQEKE